MEKILKLIKDLEISYKLFSLFRLSFENVPQK